MICEWDLLFAAEFTKSLNVIYVSMCQQWPPVRMNGLSHACVMCREKLSSSADLLPSPSLRW